MFNLFEYESLGTEGKEDYLELAIVKYLQFVQKPVERKQILEYLRKHDIFLPPEEFETNQNGQLKIQPRFSLALTSLGHAGLVTHPSRGLTYLTEHGKKIRTADTKKFKQIIQNGWDRYHAAQGVKD